MAMTLFYGSRVTSAQVGSQTNQTADQDEVKSETLAVYSAMSTASSVVKTLRKGDRVSVSLQVAGVDGTWCKIEESGQTNALGYVLCSELLRAPQPQISKSPSQVGSLPVISGPASLQPRDQFSFRKQTRYFDFRYERNSSQIDGVARFADGYIALINREFFKTDFEYPIRVVVLEDQARFEKYVHQELHEPGPAGFGIYWYSSKLLATYEDSGLGTFTHETMHAFVQRDLISCPAWADEGIPTFFEKFYGYWDNDELVLFWGFQ